MDKLPTLREIADWHQANPEPWHNALFPNLGGQLLFHSDELQKICWLTQSRHCRRVPIVPLRLGGETHPSNFVILNASVPRKAPEGTSRQAFLNWLVEEADLRQKKQEAAFQKVFGHVTHKDLKLCFAAIDRIEDTKTRMDDLLIKPPPIPPRATRTEIYLLKLKALMRQIETET